MKKLFLFAATVAMLLTTSCNNESNAPENVQLGENEFMVSIDNGAVPQKAPAIRNGMTTMTHMDGDNFVYWNMGDQIYINGTQFSANMSGDKVIFTKFYGDEPMPEPTYHAFYPITDIMDPLENTAALSLLSLWDPQDNGVKHLPMYACSNDKYLTFYNIFAVLRITIPNYTNMNTLKLETNDDVPLSGRFHVNEILEENVLKGYQAVFEDVDVQNTREIHAAESFNSGSFIYVAVPAQRYGMLRISLGDNIIERYYKIIDLSGSTAIANGELEVNKIYTVGTDDWDEIRE